MIASRRKTIFEDSSIALNKWLMAIWMLVKPTNAFRGRSFIARFA